MRVCGKCRHALRYDESLELLHDGGAYLACPRCVAAAAGVAPPAPRRYERDTTPRCGMPFPCCGLCRTALYEDDRADEILELTEEDAAALDVAAGRYLACRECRSLYERLAASR
jgi:hypothetical protein